MEERLARMWSEVMGVTNVGVTDNFFALGGHSLMAARLVSRLRDELHVALSLRSIFEDQTIRALAGRIASAQSAEGSKPVSGPDAIPRATRRKQAPLSFAQESLWFLDQLAPDRAVYNVPLSLHLTGELGRDALQRSLDEVVRRHQSLRTRFEQAGGRPVQIVEPLAGIEMPFTDLGDLPVREREAEAARLCGEDAWRPFDMARAPMLRARLLRLGPADHLLFLNMHHVVSDGWSLGVLVRELGQLYTAFSEGKESPLPELPIQYADFAVWQRDWLRGEVLQAQIDYWKKRLDGAPARLELPADHPRPATPSYRGAVESAVFPPATLAALKSLAQQNGVSLFMVLLAAFDTFLHRYTGETDIVIGSPVAGRNRRETEGLIGFFVNTVVLRSDLSGDPTFEELLRHVKGVSIEAFAHQDLPFEKLVEELNPERHPGCNPLCQILFALQNAPIETTRLGSLGLHLKEVGSGTSKFDLAVSMTETPAGLEASVEYSTDLFERGTIMRLLDHFRTLLEGVAAQPGARISALPLLATDERRRLLVEWNQTRTDYPRDLCVHQLFEAQAARTPEAVALVFEDQRVTYRDLNRKANRLAHHLRGQGVGPESLVGICIDRSVEMIVGLLGILKAGGAYLPLDASFPAERLAMMLEDTRATVILTTGRLRQNLPANGAAVICIDQDGPPPAPGSDDNPAASVTAESLAYVMFTSGSTGRPKGVSIIHRGIVRLVTATDYVEIAPRDVFLQFAPVSFDASTFEIWGALLNGARLVIFPSRLASFEELGEFIETQEVSILWLTAALFHEMVDGSVSRLRRVRQLLAGGDVISARHAGKFLECNPGSRLINGYGPTENTTFTCCCPLSSAGEVGDPVPIGRPIANTSAYVLDRNLQPVPIGVPGELYAGGDGLARGYWNRPELTADKFVPDPFGAVPGARLYKTGDIVRYLPDGRIEFLGRRDLQVKIRGYRIELAEIEAVLAQHAGVRLVAAVASEAATGGKRIVACVCRQQGSEVSSGELREFLAGRLPDYMCPAEFVFLDKMPLTPTGKLDRAALPLTVGQPAAGTDSRVDPSDWIEAQLVGLWGSVLGTPPASVRDNFFDLGGHSLLAVRLFSEIEKYLHVRLPISAIFHAPTVAELAEVVRRNAQPGTQPSSGIIPLQSKGTRRPIFFMPSFGEDEAARAGISIFHYRKLAAYLGADQPSHGVATVPDLRDIRSLAAHCAHLIRTVQAHGPYVLAGYCADGEVAYEVARQFEAVGETVELVVVFDGMAPLEKIPIAPGFTGGDWRQKLRWIAGWIFQGPGRAFERIRRRVRRILERRERLQNHMAPCRARLLLFRSEQTLGDYDDPQLGWGNLFGDVRVEIVHGDHFFLLKDPHVGFVAEKLNEYLRKPEPPGEGASGQAFCSSEKQASGQ
ncbi:MAG: amino acid adenylation domain-containing protein [Chthoniobacteraceae bacterium]